MTPAHDIIMIIIMRTRHHASRVLHVGQHSTLCSTVVGNCASALHRWSLSAALCCCGCWQCVAACVAEADMSEAGGAASPWFRDLRRPGKSSLHGAHHSTADSSADCEHTTHQICLVVVLLLC